MTLRLAAPGGRSFVPGVRQGTWSLAESDGGLSEIVVQSFPFIIGRALDCHLRLPHSPELAKTTSRWHCHVIEEGGDLAVFDGSLLPLPDTGRRKASISGTRVDGAVVSGSTPIGRESMLGVGPWTFRLRTNAPSAAFDGLLKSVDGGRSFKLDAAVPGSGQAFARLHGLFRRIEQAEDVASGLELVIEHALESVPRATVAAVIEEDPGGDMKARVARHRAHGPMADFRFNSALMRRLPKESAVILNLPPKAKDTIVGERVSSGLVVPLRSRHGRVGFLYMDNRGGTGAFSVADMHVAHALATVAALQISLDRQAFLAQLDMNMRQYFGPDVVRLLVQASREGRPLGLGVRACEATVMFVDIAGFSPLCRDRSPEEVCELLGPYYQLVADAAHSFGGHVDKFMGDGVMVVFGARPLRESGVVDENHSRQAIECGRRIIVQWGGGALSRWGPRVALRVGLHRGRVVAGNIGFVGRMEYGVIGDAVNLAARMEKLARPNGVALTDSVREAAGPGFQFVDGGFVEVHGFGRQRVWHTAAG